MLKKNIEKRLSFLQLKMLNVYIIYVSSTETGDVDMFKNVYTSYSKAQDAIDNAIQQYVTDRKSESSYLTIADKEFDAKALAKDTTLAVGSYYFKKKNSSASIYKKVLVEGRLWNGTKLVPVGKIGISREINIPIESKLLKFISFLEKDTPVVEDNDADESSEDESGVCEEISTPKGNPSNYEHGQHVSFIQELKNKLTKRRASVTGKFSDKALKKEIKPNQPTPEHQMFISSLSGAKNNLTHITPPSSPNYGLGKVIGGESEEDFEIPPIPQIPEFPIVPELGEIIKSSMGELNLPKLYWSDTPIENNNFVDSEEDTSFWDSTEEDDVNYLEPCLPDPVLSYDYDPASVTVFNPLNEDNEMTDENDITDDEEDLVESSTLSTSSDEYEEYIPDSEEDNYVDSLPTYEPENYEYSFYYNPLYLHNEATTEIPENNLTESEESYIAEIDRLLEELMDMVDDVNGSEDETTRKYITPNNTPIESAETTEFETSEFETSEYEYDLDSDSDVVVSELDYESDSRKFLVPKHTYFNNLGNVTI